MAFFMTINGQRVEATEGDTILAAARRAGIHIPTLCHHEAVKASGTCRLCRVEVSKPSGWKGLLTACVYPSAEGFVIETDNERVFAARREVLDTLLARCPNSIVIQKLAREYGINEPSAPLRNNPDDCILCTTCVRVCKTVATASIAVVKRGDDKVIGTADGEPPRDCIGCAACANVCPTHNIKVDENGTTRTVWGREFELLRCATSGETLPITKDQSEFLTKHKALDPSYFATSPKTNREKTAATLGRIARWNKLGMQMEVK